MTSSLYEGSIFRLGARRVKPVRYATLYGLKLGKGESGALPL
jgi:hypothetical protein